MSCTSIISLSLHKAFFLIACCLLLGWMPVRADCGPGVRYRTIMATRHPVISRLNLGTQKFRDIIDLGLFIQITASTCKYSTFNVQLATTRSYSSASAFSVQYDRTGYIPATRNPQANSIVERVHKTVHNYLTTFASAILY